MVVYRICNPNFTKLDGKGAKINGGRWNSPGLSVIYTAQTSALAVLECRVNLTLPPKNYMMLTIEIGDEFVDSVLRKISWNTDIAITRNEGDGYFKRKDRPDLPLRVPSAVAPEFNFLFDPTYASRCARILGSKPVEFDLRLWKSDLN